MANGEKDFDSLRFRNIIKRYEEAQLVNEDIYMEPEELTDIAEFYYDKGNISQAIKAINLAIKLFPSSTMPVIFRARLALLEEHDSALAEKYADMVCDKSDLDYYYLIAEIMIVNKHTAMADRYLHDRMEYIDEDDIADFILDVATIFVDYEKYDIAERWLAMSEDYDLPDYKELKGRIALGQGNYKRSEHIFEELLDEDPYSNHFWNRLAAAQLMDEKINDSITSSEFAIAINPEDDEALLNKANGLFRLGRYEDALEYYRRFTKLCPEDQSGYVFQGNTLINLNKIYDAISAYRTAEQKANRNPSDLIEIYQELALAYSSVDEMDKALEYVGKAEEIETSDKNELMVLKAHIYLEHNDVSNAIRYYKNAIHKSDFSRKISIHIAISIFDCGYVNITYKILKSINTFRADTNKKGLAYLALCCQQLNKEEEFLSYLKQACEEESDEAQFVLGHLFPKGFAVNEYYKYMYNKLKENTKEK